MHIIAEFLTLIKTYQKDIFLGICMILVASIGYNLGASNAFRETSGESSTEAAIYQPSGTDLPKRSISKPVPTPIPSPLDLRVVVSKSSKNKVYHHTWCGGYKQIKESNRIWVDSAEAAEAAGYTLAGNCKK